MLSLDKLKPAKERHPEDARLVVDLENGKYTAEWQGCLGKYGEASGQWTLANKRIRFTPTEEKDMMNGHLKSLDVLLFKGQWIFVPSDDREFYDKWGVSRYSCFQRNDKR